jgi:hypothetical protein
MGIDRQYFLTVFDEFSAAAPAKIDAYLEISALRVPPTVWGTRAGYAQALLTAHMLTASGSGGQGAAGGALTNEQVGDVQRGYGQVGDQASGDAALMTTRYGIDYVALRKETVVSCLVTGPATPLPAESLAGDNF